MQWQGAFGVGIGTFLGSGIQGAVSDATVPMEPRLRFAGGLQFEANIGLGHTIGVTLQATGDIGQGGPTGTTRGWQFAPKLSEKEGGGFHASVGPFGSVTLAIPAPPPELSMARGRALLFYTP